MTDPATLPSPDPAQTPSPSVRPLVLLAADDAVVCVDDLCVTPIDTARAADPAEAHETASTEPAR